MTKEIYQVKTSNGTTFEILTEPMYDSPHYIDLKRAIRNSLNAALGFRIVRSLKYIGKAVQVNHSTLNQ